VFGNPAKALRIGRLLWVAAALIAWVPGLRAQSIETRAPYVIMIDSDTNTVLLEKNSDKPVPPASLSKLMTLEVIFQALEEGRLGLDDLFHISENAWRKGGAPSRGSTMFAKLNSDVALSDLLRGIIVQSGNDACIAIAEGMAGTEEAFATLLNVRAREIELTNSNFRNSTGLPETDHYMSVRDMAKLARHIIRTYPEYYKYFAEPEFTWNNIRQFNRNPLLREAPGADGLKTGHIQESGYGLVGSTLRDGQRIILAMTGLNSIRQRADEARKLIDWAYRAFEQITVFEVGQTVGEARVYGGDKRWVKLQGDGAIKILLPRAARRRMTAHIVYNGPVLAPIEQGQRVAELRVRVEEGGVNLAVPLYSAEHIGQGRLHQRALDAALDLLTRWW